jgi:hypothetical protein
MHSIHEALGLIQHYTKEEKNVYPLIYEKKTVTIYQTIKITFKITSTS